VIEKNLGERYFVAEGVEAVPKWSLGKARREICDSGRAICEANFDFVIRQDLEVDDRPDGNDNYSSGAMGTVNAGTGVGAPTQRSPHETLRKAMSNSLED
jgi:hypothetical protein